MLAYGSGSGGGGFDVRRRATMRTPRAAVLRVLAAPLGYPAARAFGPRAACVTSRPLARCGSRGGWSRAASNDSCAGDAHGHDHGHGHADAANGVDVVASLRQLSALATAPRATAVRVHMRASPDLVCHNVMCERVGEACLCRLQLALQRAAASTALVELDVSGNRLAALPQAAVDGSMRALRVLRAEGNRLELPRASGASDVLTRTFSQQLELLGDAELTPSLHLVDLRGHGDAVASGALPSALTRRATVLTGGKDAMVDDVVSDAVASAGELLLLLDQ